MSREELYGEILENLISARHNVGQISSLDQSRNIAFDMVECGALREDTDIPLATNIIEEILTLGF